jgi:hypothetical protein
VYQTPFTRRKAMRRVSAIFALVAMTVFPAHEALAGGGAALIQPKKTSGPAVSATIVMDATATDPTATPRQFSIRVQKGGSFQAALFEGNLTYKYGCTQVGSDQFGRPFTLETSTDERFLGFMDAWVPSTVLSSLVGGFNTDPSKFPVITDIDNATCTSVAGKTYLSFTALIQFGTQ